MEKNNEEFGSKDYNIFRLVREARGISTSQLADRLEVSRSYINSIENGDRFPSEKLYQKYLSELNIDDVIVRQFDRRSKKYTSHERLLLYVLKLIGVK